MSSLRRPHASHPLQCTCGRVRGYVDSPRSANRAVCYCHDCQAFAHFLGRANDVLDERGGSDIIQTLPKFLAFTGGVDAIGCIRLTPTGPLRWYSTCCHTPIGNTPSNPKLSFIGLVHSCLSSPERSLDESFGPVTSRVNTAGAWGAPKPKAVGAARMMARAIHFILLARLSGDYRRTPLFRSEDGAPIADPRVLTSAERSELMRAVESYSR
jgi:hypothetical protein